MAMLSGEMQQDIINALLAACPLPGDMEQVVSLADLGYQFEEFLAVPGTLKSLAVRNLVVRVESDDQLIKLLKAARRKNRDNPKLKAVWRKFEPADKEFNRLGADLGAAEKVLFGQKPFQDVATWIDRLAEARHAVCRIEPQPENDPRKTTGYGSGFLVSREWIMTNFHVAEDFWSNPAAASRVRVRFDFERAADGPAVSAGKPIALADKWPTATQTSGEQEHPWQGVCSPEHELDFALLRLESTLGDRKPLVPVSHRFQSPESVMILQHPLAQPLQLSFGSVTSDTPPPNRVEYWVNTEGGSSGSPVFTQDLQLAAIHHWGTKNQNRGVTFSAILEFLRTKSAKLLALGLGAFNEMAS
jgi:hypothetical protein